MVKFTVCIVSSLLVLYKSHSFRTHSIAQQLSILSVNPEGMGSSPQKGVKNARKKGGQDVEERRMKNKDFYYQWWSVYYQDDQSTIKMIKMIIKMISNTG